MKRSPSAGTPARYAQDDRRKGRKEERKKGRKEERKD